MLRGKPKYNIGEVAKVSGLSIKTLRYYDKKGILVPPERDKSNNYRYYSEEQLLASLAIREMKLRGFSLEELQSIMNTHSLDLITEKLNQKTETIQKEIRHLEKQLQLVENSREKILRAIPDGRQTDESQNDGKIKPRKITVSVLNKMNCIYTRYRSRIYVQEVFWDRFADIYNILDKKGYMVNGPIMGVFHEHYTHQFFFDEGDLEVLQPVCDADPNDENIREFGGFLVASTIYVGFYAELLPEYVALIKWIDENDYDIVGDPIEEYLVEFTQGVSRDKYVTRISFPIRKRKLEKSSEKKKARAAQ